MNGVFEEIDSLTGKIEPTFWQEYWAWFVAAAMLLAFILGFLTRKKNKPAARKRPPVSFIWLTRPIAREGEGF